MDRGLASCDDLRDVLHRSNGMHASGGEPLGIPGRRRRRTGQTSRHPARSTQTSSPDPEGSRTSTAGLLTRGSSAGPSPSRNDPKVRSSGLSMARLSAHSCGGSRGLPAFREENRPHSLPAPSRGASPLAGARAARIITVGPRGVSNRRLGRHRGLKGPVRLDLVATSETTTMRERVVSQFEIGGG